MNESQPFGGWSPILSGIIPSAPPPALLEPPEVLFEFSYPALRAYRLQSQPYIVRATYDEVQCMIEEHIAEAHRLAYEEWMDWVERNL